MNTARFKIRSQGFWLQLLFKLKSNWDETLIIIDFWYNYYATELCVFGGKYIIKRWPLALYKHTL